jgi:hypothetical protein
MDEPTVRARADAACAALVAGDMDGVIAALSDELRRNLGEVMALLPLPAVEAGVESVERGASAFLVTLRIVSETDEVELQTRWKDRGGEPRIVEVSHLSRTAREALEAPETEEGEAPSEQA